MEAFEQFFATRIATNILTRSSSTMRASTSFTAALSEILGNRMLINQQDDEDRIDIEDIDCDDRRQVKSLVQTLNQLSQKLSRSRPSAVERNLRATSRFFGLDDLDHDILGVSVRYAMGEPWDDLIISPSRWLRADSIAASLGVSAAKVRDRLKRTGSIGRTGLLQEDADGDITVLNRFVRRMRDPDAHRVPVSDWLLPSPETATLSQTDFDHLGKSFDDIAALMRAARLGQHQGLHILLYGPPGTGKTELAKTIAETIGMRIYSVGEADASGEEPLRHERIQEYQLAQNILASDEKGLVLFDEAEDAFECETGLMLGLGAARKPRMMRGSKVFMHRMLEQARVPTIWTVNDANDLPDTVLRRMSYALKLSVPGMTVRKRIWKKAFEAADLNPAQGKVEKLAIEFAEAPALSATAVRVARLVGGDFDVARRSISGISRVMHGQVQPARTKPSCFEPSLINANMDVEAIARRLQAADAIPAFSLLVSGPPGTGKTEWVQHLAETLGIEVLSYRASDLLSPYVGETEKAIADAFADARETNRFLVFDEADSLLQDRRFAHASWQVSQVNELLTWMESHPLPFAMTTNLPEGLDQASLRRFVFKLKFDYLRPDQRGQAFHHFFGQEAPAELSALDNLTPGDLAIVKRRLSILGSNETDAHTIMSMLREECEGKPDFSRPIGFAAPAQKLAAA